MLKYFLEIKNRLFLLSFNWLLIIFVNYFYKETLLFLVLQTHNYSTNNFYFIFTNITEIFSVYLKLTMFLSTQIFILYFCYTFFIFLSPALFKLEHFYLFLSLRTSLIVWFIIIFFFNYALIPLTWNFFLSFQFFTNFIDLYFEAKLIEYLDFYILLYYLAIFYGEITITLFFLFYFINSNTKFIKKYRKLYYYFFILFSTLISPPDIFSQITISLIIIIFYELLNFFFLIKILATKIN
uniref:SecY-independent transporter protein n=1 Tax=Amicula sp. isolate GU52X-4 cfCalB7 TaxID=3003489 RepID=A0A9E8YZK8_9STRA|nr:SecY-independent transporter protein [Amicula sp. isolate GU52X-4 cfCalB7]